MDRWPALSDALRSVDGVRLWADAPLAPFTTIGTGGKVGLLVTVRDAPALACVWRLVEASEADWFCLGAGSNLLVADRGYAGVVVKLDESFQYVEGLPAPEPRRVRDRWSSPWERHRTWPVSPRSRRRPG